MTVSASHTTRRRLSSASDVILVYRAPHAAEPPFEEPEAASPDPGSDRRELFLAIDGDGCIFAFNGHVDLGTGIRTALTQIVAEELDVALADVTMELGHTAVGPNQGATIASETIQVSAIPLRQAAATLKRHLLSEAARRFNCGVDNLIVEYGLVLPACRSEAGLTYADLTRGARVELLIDEAAPLKPASAYSVVGRSVPRVDVPAKATGAWVYVHDVRVPGMLHGRVVRPPYAGVDSGPQVGRSLVSVDKASVAAIPGLVAVVTVGDFVGVVAEREEDALEAARRLDVEWRPWDGLPDLNRPEAAIRHNPSTPRRLLDRGDVDVALAACHERMDRTYVWPYQMHGSIGPSCAVADAQIDGLTVWSGTQNPHILRGELARLLDLPEDQVTVERHEAAGCYGRNCADDVTADAALLSAAVRRPVRVQLTREQEHAWEPKGSAQVMDVRGGLDGEGGPAAYDFETRYPSNGAPTLALILTGKAPAVPEVFQMGDRTAIPPYAFGNARVTVHDMPPIARASWMRGVSALPNTFAHESFMDELAAAAGVDPIEYRLRYLDDERAVDLVRAVAEKANWQPHASFGSRGGAGDILYGRGFAYAVYVHGEFPGKTAAWSAWVADVAVNRTTGEARVERVVVGQDTGLMVNPAGVRHQIHGNVLQSTSRVLKESVGFDATGVTSREWGAYPILTFADVPSVEVVLMDRQDQPPLGAGESASVPSAAAIANAIYDATGIRFRELPLTAEAIRSALNPPRIAGPGKPPKRRRGLFGGVGALAVATLGLAATAWPLRPSIAPVSTPDPASFAASAVAQGRLVAAAGACLVCHVGPYGRLYGGGRALETPFGTVFASNISPDSATGIGAWSYPAFVRAMREGVSRDGRHLYPAHPYTSFVNVDDADLRALYAYLMAQPATATTVPKTRLRFPFNIRVLMAPWNALFLRSIPVGDPLKSEAWNRGQYLVEGLGHCSACHSPRNLLGAEIKGRRHLGGGFADGWEAPPLNGSSRAPVAWTLEELYAYLRTGQSSAHGGANGPMADVVAALADLPDDDIRAMATYLANLQTAQASSLPDLAVRPDLDRSRRGAVAFVGACASCHVHGTAGPLPSLAWNTNVHSDHPDNLLQVILNGAAAPALRIAGASPSLDAVSFMPAFGESLDDATIADIAAYVRNQYAPDARTWVDLESAVARIRKLHPHS